MDFNAFTNRSPQVSYRGRRHEGTSTAAVSSYGSGSRGAPMKRFSPAGSSSGSHLTVAPLDYEQASKASIRATNLAYLKQFVFDDSLSRLASAAEVLSPRMARMLDTDLLVDSEVAEHMEKAMGLPAGWLDVKRERWDEAQTPVVRAQILAGQNRDEHATYDPSPAQSHTTATAQTTIPAVASAAPPKTEQPTLQMPRPSTAMPNKTDTPAATNQGPSFFTPELRWLAQELAKQPRGIQSRLSVLMNRRPNDLSSWVNGLRPMPQHARAELVRALEQTDPALGAQARSRFLGVSPAAVGSTGEHRHADVVSVAVTDTTESSEVNAGIGEPNATPDESAAPDAQAETSAAPPGPVFVDFIESHDVTQEVRPVQQIVQAVQAAAAAPVPELAQIPLSTQTDAPATSMREQNAGGSTYIGFTGADRRKFQAEKVSDVQTEIDKMALETAKTISEIIQSVIRRGH